MIAATRRTTLAGMAAGAAAALLPSRVSAQAGPAMSAGLLREVRERLGTPGMAAAWQLTGAAPAIIVDGLRAAGRPEPVTRDDLWHIGSITKSFTATLFARAVETGLIGWNTRLGRIIKDVPRPYARLTGLELLSHRGGLASDIPLAELMALPRIEADPRASRRRYAASALAQPLLAAPRRRYAYSNAGYVLAALMLEEASGLSWEDLLRREVLTPLGLASAGFGPPGGPLLIDQPRGHVSGQSVWIDNPAAMAPAGGLHMSAADLLAWLAAHRDRPVRFLSPASWAMLHRPHFGGDYALGWIAGRSGSLWHNGSNTAWYAEAAVEPATGLIALVCANDAALLTRQRALLPAIRRAAGVAP